MLLVFLALILTLEVSYVAVFLNTTVGENFFSFSHSFQPSNNTYLHSFLPASPSSTQNPNRSTQIMEKAVFLVTDAIEPSSKRRQSENSMSRAMSLFRFLHGIYRDLEKNARFDLVSFIISSTHQKVGCFKRFSAEK